MSHPTFVAKPIPTTNGEARRAIRCLAAALLRLADAKEKDKLDHLSRDDVMIGFDLEPWQADAVMANAVSSGHDGRPVVTREEAEDLIARLQPSWEHSRSPRGDDQ